jgi:hypothetical protein
MSRRLAAGALAVALAVAVAVALGGRGRTEAADDSGPMLSHAVYFSLKDNSPDAKKKLVEACKKYLAKHPGEVFFAAGTRAEDLRREVNDQDFDVALVIVFKNKAAQDQYQGAKRHLDFIAENKDNWKKVRVFDALVEK